MTWVDAAISRVKEPLEVIIYEFNMKIKCVNTASMK